MVNLIPGATHMLLIVPVPVWEARKLQQSELPCYTAVGVQAFQLKCVLQHHGQDCETLQVCVSSTLAPRELQPGCAQEISTPNTPHKHQGHQSNEQRRSEKSKNTQVTQIRNETSRGWRDSSMGWSRLWGQETWVDPQHRTVP